MGHGIYVRSSLKFSKEVGEEDLKRLFADLRVDENGESPEFAFWRFADDRLVSVQNKHVDATPLEEIEKLRGALDPLGVKLDGTILYVDYDCCDIGFLWVVNSAGLLLDFCDVKTAQWEAMHANFANFDDDEPYRYGVFTKYY